MSGQNWYGLGTIIHLLQNKICPHCLSKMICMEVYHDHQIWVCMYCDLPQEEIECYYTNVCWSCGNDIDSRVDRKSDNPGMGYHCSLCGKDLTEWYVNYKGGQIYESSVRQQGFYTH